MTIAVYDIETVDWNKFQNAAIYDGEHSYIYNSAKELALGMIALSRDVKHRVYYAHYGGKFDIKFILNHLASMCELKYTVIGSSLAKICVYQRKHKLFEIRDSFHLLPSSLKLLGESYQTKHQKLDVDRTKIEQLSKAELEEYVVNDCIVLYEVIQKVMESVKSKNLGLTVASDSFKDWKKIVDDESKYRTVAGNDAFIREAYYGGRTEVFTRHIKDAYYYDVVSMYPFVMQTKEYPCGFTYYSKTFDATKLGIYNVTIKSPDHEHIPFLPYRDPTSKRLLFPIGTWTATYTSAELLKAKDLGYTFVVNKGLLWSNRGDPFSAYVQKWFAVKDEGKRLGDVAKTYLAKLRLNSLYGKFAQRREFKRICHSLTQALDKTSNGEVNTVIDDDDMELFSYTTQDNRPFTYAHIGTFVTSYARIRLYEGFEAVQKAGGQVIYCDTDSIVSTAKIPSGKSLGDFELQKEILAGVFVVPKVYAVITPDGEEVARAKGFDASIVNYNQLYDFLFYGEKMETKRDGIIGFFEASRRKMQITDVIDKTRVLTDQFTKRVLVSIIHTKAIYISGSSSSSTNERSTIQTPPTSTTN